MKITVEKKDLKYIKIVHIGKYYYMYYKECLRYIFTTKKYLEFIEGIKDL